MKQKTIKIKQEVNHTSTETPGLDTGHKESKQQKSETRNKLRCSRESKL